ncbi:MAG: hypothetical protein NVS3B16_21720 [Vulcanimicrobiaceae bacterium]
MQRLSNESSTPHRRARACERGQLLPLLAFGIVALLSMVALGVDLGYWRYQQRLEQSAADSAAIAGSIRTYYPVTAGTPAPAEVTAAARLAASTNGFADDGGAGLVTVAVNSPPLSGSHSTDPTAVEVIITKKQPAFFGPSNQLVSARAVALHTLDNGPACFYQIDKNSYLTLNAGSVDAINCSVSTNGAVTVGGSFTATGLAWYGATPPIISFTGPISHIPTPVSDPCLRISGCAYLSTQPIPATPPAGAVVDAATLTAPPSPGSLSVSGGITQPTFFNPGIYYIYGGISATVSGNGVTIINVNGPFTVSGTSSTPPTITAPTTGPTTGVAYFQPASNTSPFTGNGTPTTWNGLYYAPSSFFQSNGKLDNYAELIIGGININGNKTLTIKPALGVGLTAVQQAMTPTHAALAE